MKTYRMISLCLSFIMFVVFCVLTVINYDKPDFSCLYYGLLSIMAIGIGILCAVVFIEDSKILKDEKH
jgi:archaellum biogenesis protein FlaJ (TadC family)